MACSQRPGPRAAITYINEACGVHLTQADWHHLRSLAEHHLGHRLSTSYADAEEVQRVANDLIDKFEGTAAQKAEFVRGFTRARNTSGTVDVVAAIVAHDTLNQLEERPRRVSKQQRERKANGENGDMSMDVAPEWVVDLDAKASGLGDVVDVRMALSKYRDQPEHLKELVSGSSDPRVINEAWGFMSEAERHSAMPNLLANPNTSRDTLADIEVGIVMTVPEDDEYRRLDDLIAYNRERNADVLASLKAHPNADSADALTEGHPRWVEFRNGIDTRNLTRAAGQLGDRRVIVQDAETGKEIEGKLRLDRDGRPTVIPKGSRSNGTLLFPAATVKGHDGYFGARSVVDAATKEVILDFE